MTDFPEYGPAFSQLTEKQKRFVLAMASDPFGSHAEWARNAGYSDVAEGARVSAHRLMQNERIQAATLEVAKGNLQTVGPALATAVLLEIAADRNHRDQMRAAELIANRVGLHETQEIHVTHSNLTGQALLDRLAEVAARLGMDPVKLIGANVIEGEAEEVKADAVRDTRRVAAGASQD